MKLLQAILILIVLSTVQPVVGQNSQPLYDTMPEALSLTERLPLLDEIRCIAYLFNKDFRVHDSADYLIVDMFISDVWSWKDLFHYKGISHKIYKSFYKICVHENMGFYERHFRFFLVRFFDKDGSLVNYELFPIKPEGVMSADMRNIELTCGALRLPTTFNIKRKKLRTFTFCADSTEQNYFYKVLYRHFDKLNYLHKEWKQWQVYFLSCTGQAKVLHTISLTDE